MYVAGWAKRGPSGIIATNKWDSEETVDSLKVEEFNYNLRHNRTLTDIIKEKNLQYTTWEDWKLLDRIEKEKGVGGLPKKEREKIPTKREMLHFIQNK